jgi:hypothetical protein
VAQSIPPLRQPAAVLADPGQRTPSEHLAHAATGVVYASKSDVGISLETNLDQAKTSVAADEATQQALESEIQKAGVQLTQMTNNGVTLDRLQRQVENDKGGLPFLRAQERRGAHRTGS